MTDLVWVISSSIMILAAIVIRAVFGKKMSAGLRYALWGLVLIRLLIPGTVFSSPVSVEAAVEKTEVGSDIEAVRGYSEVSLVKEKKAGSSAPQVIIKDASELPLSEDGSRFGERVNVVARDGERTRTVVEDATPARYEKIKKTVEIRDVLNIVWLSGTAAAAAYFLAVNLLFYLKLRKSRVRLDTEAPCRVYCADGLSSSCLFFGAVYISKETAEDPDSLRFVLAHELAHRRHGDTFIALLRDAALALHWYNPLVWIAAPLSRRDSEIFADAGAIKNLGEDERENYGMMLIRLSAKHGALANIGVAATTMTNGKHTIKERIKHMSKAAKMSVTIAVAVILLAAAALGISFLGGNKKTESTEAENAGGTTPEELPDDTPDRTAEPTPQASFKPETPKDVTEAFLRDSAVYEYLYEPKELSLYTIESVPESERAELGEALAGYPAFRAAQERPSFCDPGLDGGGTDALLANLLLHSREVMYYCAVGEIYDTQYKSFIPMYTFGGVVTDGRFALVAVREGLRYRYAELYEDSYEATDYAVWLVNYKDEWRIAAVESNSEFFEEYHGKGFDLEKELGGVREAYELWKEDEWFLDEAWKLVEDVERLYNVAFDKDACDFGRVTESGRNLNWFDGTSGFRLTVGFAEDEPGVWRTGMDRVSLYRDPPLDGVDMEKYGRDYVSLYPFSITFTREELENAGYSPDGGEGDIDAAAEYTANYIAGLFTALPEDNYFRCTDAGVSMIVRSPDEWRTHEAHVALMPADYSKWGAAYADIETGGLCAEPEYYGYYTIWFGINAVRNGDGSFTVTLDYGS